MRYIALAPVALLMVVLAACDDPNAGLYDPLMREDTVDLAVPLADAEIPTALDVSYATSPIRGRFPELVGDAEEWDVAIRRGEGGLRFVPAGVFGFNNPIGGPTTAGVTAPLDRSIDEVVQAPADSTLLRDESVAIVNGGVYVVRSRATAASFSGCQNYAKVQPLEVDVDAGLVKLRVIGNARCNDRRLLGVDD